MPRWQMRDILARPSSHGREQECPMQAGEVQELEVVEEARPAALQLLPAGIH